MARRRLTNGDDTHTGTPGSDRIWGQGGHDRIDGSGGTDWLWGGPGNDSLHGGDGRDTIHGNAGDDELWGDAGNDVLWGDQGRDILHGGEGNDRLGGGFSGNQLYGEGGDDTLLYNPGRIRAGDGETSILDGGEGYDILRVTNETYYPARGEATGTFVYLGGGAPHDDPEVTLSRIIFSGLEVDEDPWTVAEVSGIEQYEFAGHWLFFQNNTDQGVTVRGTKHGDTFLGGIGDDVFIGGKGNDDVQLSDGFDIVRSERSDADTVLVRGAGTTTFHGFNGAGRPGGDVVNFSEFHTPSVSVSESGGSTLFDWGTGTLTVDATGLVAGTDWFFVA